MKNTLDYVVSYPSLYEVVIIGELRFENLSDYDQIFPMIVDRILSCFDTFIIDIRQLAYLNCAGITSFTKLFILAKSSEKKLLLLFSEHVAWQRNFITSIVSLSPLITFQKH
ncbi:MAG: hypothetical protein VW378_01150 [bacterium]